MLHITHYGHKIDIFEDWHIGDFMSLTIALLMIGGMWLALKMFGWQQELNCSVTENQARHCEFVKDELLMKERVLMGNIGPESRVEIQEHRHRRKRGGVYYTYSVHLHAGTISQRLHEFDGEANATLAKNRIDDFLRGDVEDLHLEFPPEVSTWLEAVMFSIMVMFLLFYTRRFHTVVEPTRQNIAVQTEFLFGLYKRVESCSFADVVDVVEDTQKRGAAFQLALKNGKTIKLCDAFSKNTAEVHAQLKTIFGVPQS